VAHTRSFLSEEPGEDAAPDIAPRAELLADVTRRAEECSTAAPLWQYRAMQAEERLAQLEAGPIAAHVNQAAGLIHESGHQPSYVAVEASETRQSAWRRWWRRMTGGS
jgi:hypothetical protein